jgi:hypothetical protein
VGPAVIGGGAFQEAKLGALYKAHSNKRKNINIFNIVPLEEIVYC